MAFNDRTPEFRNTLKEKVAQFPPSKRRKNTRNGARGDDVVDKDYIGKAYEILGHITALTRMLASIRRPYLNIDARAPPFSRSSGRPLDLSASTADVWSNIRYLTNEERDQIDLQARVIISRCADRVKEMEEFEKRRAAIAASKTNPLARLLPARLLTHDLGTASADFIAAHHASIAWYLNRRLAETSDTQREMQEERMRRQVHRTKTLGAGATHEALAFETPSGGSLAVPASMQREASTGSSIDSWLGGVPGSLASNIAASIRDPFVGSSSSSIPVAVEDEADSSEDELELSQSQIMQFEAENAHMLREMQDTLQSVQQAEARLLEISSLQTELVTQLQRQTELTDQLYEDAIAATGSVEKGNVQLREARRRAKDSRLFVLIFLIGASLSLLFLHYY